MTSNALRRVAGKARLISGLAFLLGPLVATSCSHYSERFTYYDEQGQTNHVVNVSHTTFLVWGEASKLSTETQTGEFIRTVNSEEIMSRPDSEFIKALTEGIMKGVTQGAGFP